jgi:hypothetical protein
MCPLCAGKHKLKECTAPRDEYKCINFMMYNKYNHISSINADHSSLERKCSSMQEMIAKYKQNNDY